MQSVVAASYVRAPDLGPKLNVGTNNARNATKHRQTAVSALTGHNQLVV